MKLYGHPLSGNTHRAQALLALLNVSHDYEVVDMQNGAHNNLNFWQ